MTTNPATLAEHGAIDGARFLRVTPLLDADAAAIRDLVDERGWRGLEPMARVGAVYDYVRDEIRFGYNTDDDIAASRVLADGYGQCNTKATLLMALLRASGIACRFHAATIDKRLQRGVVTGVFYRMAPAEILHSWVEVDVGGEWKRLEGVILDDGYLDGLRRRLPGDTRALVGYAVGTDDLAAPPIEWSGEHTAIQMTGVVRDLGVFDDPDEFYAASGTNLSGIRGLLYRHLVRRVMNRRVRSIARSV